MGKYKGIDLTLCEFLQKVLLQGEFQSSGTKGLIQSNKTKVEVMVGWKG